MCTAVQIPYEGGAVLGRTMDFEVHVDYNILFLPRGYVFGRDLFGKPLRARYEAIGLCFRNKDPLKDGVNEHGLMGVTNDFKGFQLYPNHTVEEKTNLASLDYLNYALTQYRSVEEVVADLPHIHFSTKDANGEDVITPDFHHLFADPSGRCIVVEPKDKGIVYYENPYGVMTNSPRFDSHTRRLHKQIDMQRPEAFRSAKDLPGGYDPVSRFIKAVYLRRMSPAYKNGSDALAQCYNIMNTVSLPEGFIRNQQYEDFTVTRYTSAYDANKRLLTVRTALNPDVYQIALDDLADKSHRQALYLNTRFAGIPVL